LFEYARKKLPTIAPNVETLFLMSADEIGAFYNLWIVPQERLIHLKHLELAMVGPRTVISFHTDTCFLFLFSSLAQHWKLLSCMYVIFVTPSVIYFF